jgi:outer membrane protein assembly factor BamC
VLAALHVVTGCSVFEEDKINYKSAAKAQTLAVPPDLTQLRKDSPYILESNSASASGYAQAGQTVKDAGTAANRMGDVRIERSGQQRWLVVDRPADKVWDTLREFWTSNGFVLTTDAADLGIMETDWAENRAKIPQDFIRRTIGKVLDGLYSTGERDRFRTRIERNATGGVEIYVTHRGMVEEYESQRKDRTIWMPRPADPELEIEFMRRLMVALGAPKDQAAKAGAQASAASASAEAGNTIGQWQSQPALLLGDEMDRAWRRTSLALDRSGFTVEDRDRSKGLFFVRYVAAGDKQELGFFAKLFGEKPKGPELTRYQVQVQARAEGGCAVTVLTQAGQPENSDNAGKILKLLSAELR